VTTYTYRQPSEEWLALRRRREALGLSRNALAERSGVYHDSIYNAETGKTKKPHGSTLVVLQQTLDIIERERGVVVPEELPDLPDVVASTSTVRVTIADVSIEIPVHETETINLVIDRVMENLKNSSHGEADRQSV
jgi:transcriptional regulator with XRE-family HTH domain